MYSINSTALITSKSVKLVEIDNSNAVTLVTTTAFDSKDVAIKMNLLLYRIHNEQTDM